MTGSYNRFGSGSEEYFRQLITGGDIEVQPEEAPGIMSRSRFAGRGAPVAIVTPPEQPAAPDMSFFESFAKWLGRSSDDPERVADSVLNVSQPARPNDALDDWEDMPPAPGRESSTRQALGTAPTPTRVPDRGTGAIDLETALDKIMESEGGFQQWEDDRGNYVNGRLIGTNKGITPNALAEYRGVDPSTITVDDIRNVSDEEARDIFLQKYYFANGLDRLPPHLQANVLDMYINSGRNAISILQDMLGVERDGALGPQTLEALENSNITNKMYAERRVQFYNAIVRNDPSQRGFLQGWLNRANRYMED